MRPGWELLRIGCDPGYRGSQRLPKLRANVSRARLIQSTASARSARAWPSRPFPASTSTRSCASRRSGRSAMTIASPPNAQAADPGKPDAAPFRQGAGQGPCLPGRIARRLSRTALHRPLRRERTTQDDRRRPSRRLNPLGGETPWTAWTASGLPTPPTAEQSRRSGHLMRCQNRSTSFAIDTVSRAGIAD